jgi:branched-chain amino acid transport system ATP-binding protein
MTALLDVRKLDAWYGPTQVLHGLDFSLEPGSIATLLGANGAGKTTTLRALTSMVKTRGEVSIEGTRIETRATEDIVRMGVAHVPDGRGTFLDLTARRTCGSAAMCAATGARLPATSSGCTDTFRG